MKQIIKQTKSVFLIFTIITLLATCQSPDTPSAFTKPAETRLSEAVNTYYDALCNSQEGWTLEYDDLTLKYDGLAIPLGKYSFAMKFKTSGEVEVTSDIYSLTDIKVGYYTLNIGNTVELSFSTYTQLHYLSDPDIGVYGQGLAGFGFLLTDISADGNTITMKQRAGEHKTVYLKKIISSFQEVKDKYIGQASTAERLTSLLIDNPDADTLFLMLKNSSGIRVAGFDYDSTLRIAYLNFSAVDINKTQDTGIAFAVVPNREGFLLVNNKLPADFPFRDLNFKWDDAQKIFINSESYTIGHGGYTDFSAARKNKIYADFVSEFLFLKYTHLVWRKDDPDVIEVFDNSSPAARALLTDSIKSVSMYFVYNTTQAVIEFLNTERGFARYDTFDVFYPNPLTGGAYFVRNGTGYNSADAETHFTTTPSGRHADALSDLFASPEGLLIAQESWIFISNRIYTTYRVIFFKNPSISFVTYSSDT